MFFSNKLLFQHLWLHLILYYRRKVGFPCGLFGESSKDDYETVWEVESAQTECPCVCHDLCIAYKSISITSGYVSGSIKYKHKGRWFFKQDVKCGTNWLCGCCLRFDLDNHYWQTGAEPYLVVLRCRLQVVHEQLLVLWQQGEHHCQPIEDQQEAFGQGSLVWKRNTRRGLCEYNMLVVLSTAFYPINVLYCCLRYRQSCDICRGSGSSQLIVASERCT